jgi:hypothetical protein
MTFAPSTSIYFVEILTPECRVIGKITEFGAGSLIVIEGGPRVELLKEFPARADPGLEAPGCAAPTVPPTDQPTLETSSTT